MFCTGRELSLRETSDLPSFSQVGPGVEEQNVGGLDHMEGSIMTGKGTLRTDGSFQMGRKNLKPRWKVPVGTKQQKATSLPETGK